MEEMKEQRGFLAWFVGNHVAANLLMSLIIAAGLLTIFTIRIEFFPDMSLETITVTVPYLGASPAEVEEGVCLRVEEAVMAVDGVKRMYSTAAENAGMVTIEVDEYADTQQVLDDVKAEVDRIITFPEETEKPIIREVTTRHEVMNIVVYGEVSERTLRELSQEIRDDLTAMEDVSQVDISGTRPYEISIEVSEENLRKYGLSFDDVAGIVAKSSVDIPGGSVKTGGGEILVRTKGQRYTGRQFEQIVVFTRNDGTQIRLGDISNVIDGFEDTDVSSRFDGRPAASLQVFRVGDQGALDIADVVYKYVDEKKTSLPDGVSLAIWQDTTPVLRSRMNLLKRNGFLGLLLVFLCLSVFLHIRLAFWTTLGIPISFFGAFWLMPIFGVSLNMASLFAFIMSLGLVVDDAIVVGENIFAYRQRGMSGPESAIKGVREMAAPVTMAVLTTMFAFMPLLYMTGTLGKMLRVIPVVVISVLAVSLVEALLILPSHLSKSKVKSAGEARGKLGRFQQMIAEKLERFVNGRFASFVVFAVRWRYVTLACCLAVFLTIIGSIQGGYIKFSFFDPVEADNVVATLTMPQGTALEQTKVVVEKLEKAAEKVRQEFDQGREDEPSIFRHVSTTIGEQPSSRGGGPERVQSSGLSYGHLAEVNIELLDGELRDVSSVKLKNRWREVVGEISGVSSLTFLSEIFGAGDDINLELSHRDFDTLLAAAERLKTVLAGYGGVSDISDSFEAGKAELKLELSDSGRLLGLTLSDLARQVRQGFYGQQVQRIQRGRDDIRVMVRYPQNERVSIGDVEDMRIRLADGTEIPFRQVANVEYGRGFATIRRADRQRIVNVTADVDEYLANAAEINTEVFEKFLPKLAGEYPGLRYRFAGTERERNESLASLRVNFLIALLAIYGLLAVQFRSYAQPAIVMSAIPFGLVGAVCGHLLLGFNLSILSLFGIVALSGVVVNDSLILIDLINRERQSGLELSQIIRDCATRRFRPIMLTTLTTFFGLIPMMLERSMQARFLIPMAISLAFGVLFATLITLFLVPSLYMILEDIKGWFRKAFWAGLN